MRERTTEEWAAWWHVTQRAIQKWIVAHAAGLMPHVSDIPGMLAWELTAKRQSDSFRARCAEIRAGGKTEAPALPADEKAATLLDWKTFKANLTAKGPVDHQAQVSDLSTFLEFYKAKLEEANESNRTGDVKFYNELVLDTSNTIRQQKLAADKLGIEEGQLFAKDELARIFRAWAFWSMRGVDADLAELCPKLVGVTSVAEVRASLEPWLLSTRFVKPFARAARIESESALAPWIAAEIKDAVDDFIEDGAKEFEEVAK